MQLLLAFVAANQLYGQAFAAFVPDDDQSSARARRRGGSDAERDRDGAAWPARRATATVADRFHLVADGAPASDHDDYDYDYDYDADRADDHGAVRI